MDIGKLVRLNRPRRGTGRAIPLEKGRKLTMFDATSFRTELSLRLINIAFVAASVCGLGLLLTAVLRPREGRPGSASAGRRTGRTAGYSCGRIKNNHAGCGRSRQERQGFETN